MRRNWIAILCLALLVNIINHSTAQEVKKITLTGRVVDSNARPLAGAEVAAYETFYIYSSRQEYTKLLDQIKKTDVNGYFVLNTEISSPRRVFIVARKKGMAVGWDVLDSANSNNSKGSFLIILEKPGTLAGTVVDENGNPIAKAKVRAIPKTSYLSRLDQRPVLAPEQWFTTQTDAKGKFSFSNFAPDVSADFWIKAPGKVSIYKFTPHYTNSCGYEVGRTDVRIVLPPEAPIQGRVVDAETKNPIAGVSLLIRPDNIREHLNPYCPHLVISGQDGQFSFDGIPAGKHLLEVISPEKEMAKWVGKSVKLDVRQGQATKDVTVEVEKGVIIETVVREGTTKKPLHNIRVTAYNESSSGRAWTNAEGVARIRVPTGEFNFYAGGEGYSYYRANEPITVAKNQTTHLEIQLDRNPVVSGIVRDKNDQPVASIAVASKPVCEQAVLTNADGQFEVSWPRRSSIRKKFLLARDTQRNLAGLVEFKDESQPIDIRLEPAFTLKGQVADPDGKRIAMAVIGLWASLPGWSTNVGEQVFTDAKGFYQISAVPPPQLDFSYRIETIAKGYGPLSLSKIPFGDDLAKPVEIDTIVLPPADQSISGVVVDSEGEPAAGVPIFLRGPSGSRTAGQPRRVTVTDAHGRFLIDRICKGRLRLQANFGSSPGGMGFLEAQGGDKDVKIILGQRLVHTKYVSLIGKPLPELKDLKVDLYPADINDKILLVCFWDMQQRPSRNCIMRLAKQAEQLKQRDVTVVTIQTSKIDENKLNEWVKNYNIPFPVGMVQGDVEKTRFAWGVKFLPWMILTDHEHIVQAEGFAPTELDEKISAIAQKQN